MTTVFLSYARSDDEAFVADLYHRLSDAGFFVWWDRISMPSRGLTFLREIRDAISRSDRHLVVLGPVAVSSDYVRAEWQHALAEGKAVTPVLRIGNYDLVPAELRPFHTPDFRFTPEQPDQEAVFDTLKALLREPVPRLGLLHGEIPGPPPHFQPRPDDLTRIAETVLIDESRPVSLTVGERAVLLHGMGGLGKTVLAAAFARSTSARRAFPAGVYWLVAGEDAEPFRLIRQLLALLGDTGAVAPDLSAGASRVREFLASRCALIVVDNVWRIEPLEPLVGALGTSARILATTRESGLVSALGARGLSLGLLSEESALRHLADWTGLTPDTMPPQARELARECGYLPFALALNGAMLRDGNSWTDLLEALRGAELDFAEQRFANYPHRTVLRSINVSLDFLQREDAAAAERYRELAGFIGDQAIPEAAVLTLWHHRSALEDRHARKLLLTLERKSLVRFDGTPPVRRVVLHDLQWDFLRATVDDPTALNAAVLSGYHTLCANDWPSGPNDGYFHRHLVAHLVAAGDPEEVHRVLALETSDGRNAWYEANDAIGDVDGYLDDIDAAWQLADQAVSVTPVLEGLRNRAVALQCRYALIVASVNSLATNLPARLLRMLMATGDPRWPASWALSQARRNTDKTQRVRAVTELAPHLPAFLVRAAIEIADGWAEPVAALAPQLAEADRRAALTRVLDVSFQGSDERVEKVIASLAPWLTADLMPRALALVGQRLSLQEQGDAISTLLPHLPDDLLNEARDAIGWLTLGHHEASLAKAVVALAPRLEEQAAREVLAEALTIVRASNDPGERALALAVLAPALVDDECRAVRTEACEAAREIRVHRRRGDGDKWSAVKTLTEIASHLPDAERPPVVAEALRIAESMADVITRGKAEALTMVAPWLQSESFGRFLAALGSLSDDFYYRAVALSELAPRLPDELVAEAVEMARAIKDPSLRGRSLLALTPRLSQVERSDLVTEAFQAAASIDDPRQRVHALLDVIPALPETVRHKVLSESVAAMRAIGDGKALAGALLVVAPHLPDDLLAEVLAVGRIELKALSAKSLAALGPRFTDDLVAEALRGARGLMDTEARAEELATLAPWLSAAELRMVIADIVDARPGVGHLVTLSSRVPALERAALLAEALKAARGISYLPSRMAALTQIAPSLTDDERLVVLTEALEIAQHDDTSNARYSFDKVISQLPDELIPRAFDVLREHLSEGWWQASALAAVAPRLPDSLIQPALAIAHGIKDPPKQVHALVALAPRLSDSECRATVTRAFELAQAIEDDDVDYAASAAGATPDGSRAWALEKLAPQLPEELMGLALATIRSRARESGARALAALAPRLPTALMGEALETVCILGSTSDRTLAALASRLPAGLLVDALAIARTFENRESQVLALGALTSWLPDAECRAVLAEAIAIARTVWQGGQASALLALAPQLPDADRRAVLAEALQIAARHLSVSEDTLVEMGTQCTQLSPVARARLWSDTLRALALSRARPDFIAALLTFAPVVTALIDGTWRAPIAQTILKLRKWFP